MDNRFFPTQRLCSRVFFLSDSVQAQMFQQFLSAISAGFLRRIGYRIVIMADQKQSPEFLGGGPKFNTVGKDNHSAPGLEEPVIAPNQTGYWVRVSAIILVVIVLAGALFYLNDHDLSKAAAPGGRAVSPDAKPEVTPDARPSAE